MLLNQRSTFQGRWFKCKTSIHTRQGKSRLLLTASWSSITHAGNWSTKPNFVCCPLLTFLFPFIYLFICMKVVSSLGCFCLGFCLSTTYLLWCSQRVLTLPFPGKPWCAIFVRGHSSKSSLQQTWGSVLVAMRNLIAIPCLSLCLGDVGNAGQPENLPRWHSCLLARIDVSQAVWPCGGEFQGGEFSLDLPAQNQCRQSAFDVTAL